MMSRAWTSVMTSVLTLRRASLVSSPRTLERRDSQIDAGHAVCKIEAVQHSLIVGAEERALVGKAARWVYRNQVRGIRGGMGNSRHQHSKTSILLVQSFG